MLVFNEINVRGPKLIYGHVFVGNIRPIIPKDHPRVFVEGPMMVAKAAQGSPSMDGKRRTMAWSTPRRWWSSSGT